MRVLHWLISLFTFAWGARAADQERLYINYASKPSAQDLLRYNLCILDPWSQADLAPGQKKGHTYLAYLSVVEVADASPMHQRAVTRGVSFGAKNPAWSSHVMDVGSDAWKNHLLEDGVRRAREAGYQGLFIDTADSVSLLGDPAQQKMARSDIVDLLREVGKSWPEARIIINRAFDLLPQLQTTVHGVLVESVYQTFDASRKRFIPVSEPDSAWVVARIKEAQNLGFTLYTVDYVSPANLDLARQTVTRLRALDTVPLVTTPQLRGRVLAPVAED